MIGFGQVVGGRGGAGVRKGYVGLIPCCSVRFSWMGFLDIYLTIFVGFAVSNQD